MEKYILNCNCKYGKKGDVVELPADEAKRWGFEKAEKDTEKITEAVKPAKNKAMSTKDVMKK